MLLLDTTPRAPAFHDWPERHQRLATVVCEGPSACLASPGELQRAVLDGPCVAVNRAIAFSETLPFDAWATMDDPRHLWTWAKPYLHRKTKLFSGDDSPNIFIWRRILGDQNIGRLYTRTPTYMEGIFDTPKAPMVPTIFHTLAWLLQVGARHVRLIGCDMKGTGSPIGPEWAEGDDLAHTIRWNVEREMLSLSEDHYRAKGARIERWHP